MDDTVGTVVSNAGQTHAICGIASQAYTQEMRPDVTASTDFHAFLANLNQFKAKQLTAPRPQVIYNCNPSRACCDGDCHCRASAARAWAARVGCASDADR